MSGVTFAGTQNDRFQWDIGSGRYRSEYMEQAKALREKYGQNADSNPTFQREMKELQQRYASNPAAGYTGKSPASGTPVAEQPSVFVNNNTQTNITEKIYEDCSQIQQNKSDKKKTLDFMN